MTSSAKRRAGRKGAMKSPWAFKKSKRYSELKEKGIAVHPDKIKRRETVNLFQ